MTAFEWLQIMTNVLFVLILWFLNRRVDNLPTWEISTDKTLTDYDKLIKANYTINKQRKEIEKLKQRLEIERMNHSLEDHYDRS